MLIHIRVKIRQMRRSKHFVVLSDAIWIDKNALWCYNLSDPVIGDEKIWIR